MKEVLNNFFISNNYLIATTTFSEIMVYFLPSNGNVEVVVTIDYQKEIYLSGEIYSSVRENFIQSFKGQGFTNVHMLTLVMCRDVKMLQSIIEEDRFCWYIDTEEKRLNIPEGNVEDFYGLKGKLEEFLNNPQLFAEATKVEENLPKKQNMKLKELPFINITIVAINILVFILCAFIPDVLYNKGAFSFLLIEKTKEYYRFLSSAFMHADLDHLFSNMLVLFFLGNLVEKKVGHLKYMWLYLLSAILGNVASAIYEIHLGYMFFSVGASGAIFGVIGAVLVLVLAKGGRWETITLPRMLLMVGYSLYSGFVVENVNNAAHIGGFVAGALIMGIFCLIDMLRKRKEVFHEN